ncbi:hypothetical protein RUMCAL_02272 [Ruminococcus callidus ATCC 27760]|uniref:Uncharacterized protein n=1 Tax=Ruminococcus callidus ATCC 27760 TaxID=411473 RepID=U2KMK9_9FIRM|nr:hypothetical protein RUMCAL_02272 [Ruminococcus callidus ATCC 27760]
MCCPESFSESALSIPPALCYNRNSITTSEVKSRVPVPRRL